MAFQTKKFNSIIASMINWVSSSTNKITDFNIGSVTRTVLEAVAIELEELYYQLLKAVEEAIEEAIYRAFNFPRNPAEKATGLERFTRLPSAENEIVIPMGTLVSTDTAPPIYFETQAPASLPAITGNATGGSSTQLIDTSRNFESLGITEGSRVVNVTDGGESFANGFTVTGSATGGSFVTMIDTTKDFVQLGVIAGSIITNVTADWSQTILLISTTGISGASGAAGVGTTTLKLIDTTKNFLALGVLPGHYVIRYVSGVQTGYAAISTLSTTTNPNDTLNLVVPIPSLAIGDDYKVAANLNDTLNFVAGGTAFALGNSYSITVPFMSTTTNANDTLNFPSLSGGASFTRFVPRILYYDGTALTYDDYSDFSIFDVDLRAPVSGAATSGNTITLVDVSKNFTDLRIAIGDTVVRTAGGSSVVTSISTTTNPNDTLNFAALSGGNSFSPGDVYTVSSYNDYLYIGLDRQIDFLTYNPYIANQIISTLAGEYWNGTTWVLLPGFFDGTDGGTTTKKTFSTSGNLTWNIPTDWVRNVIQSFNLYWIRLKVDTSLSAAPTYSQSAGIIFPGKDYKVIVVSKDIDVQATTAGTVGNVSANTIVTLKSNISGINSVTNPAAFSTGREEETDLERKARFALYIQSLARATRGALEYAALSIPQVVAAKAIDDVRPTVFKYYASDLTYHDITTEMRNPGDAAVDLFENITPGAGSCLYFGATELYEYINIHLTITAGSSSGYIWEYCNSPDGSTWADLTPYPTDLEDGTNNGSGTLTQDGTVSWTIPGDWMACEVNSVQRLWIRLRITSSGTVFTTLPKGNWCSLPPGLGYVYLYVHDGSGEATATLKESVSAAVELYRGCGIIVDIKSPTKIQPSIDVDLYVFANYDADLIGNNVRQKIIDFLNAKKLGEDLYVSEIYQLIMDFNDKAIANTIVSAPIEDIVVASSAVLRPNTTATYPTLGYIRVISHTI